MDGDLFPLVDLFWDEGEFVANSVTAPCLPGIVLCA